MSDQEPIPEYFMNKGYMKEIVTRFKKKLCKLKPL